MLQEGIVRLRIHDYPLHRFNFPAVISELLGLPQLDELHLVYEPTTEQAGDQGNAAHRAFYGGFDSLQPLYQEFLRTQILPLFGQDICVQRVPSFRIGLPGGLAVREFHVDSDYNHQIETVNFWLPVTKAFGTNTMWVENAPHSGSYNPAELEPGQFLQFDATMLRHGNLPNTTGKTRVSFDFRVIPLKAYRPRGLRTVSAGVRLELGAYYTLLTAGGMFVETDNPEGAT